MSSHPERSSSWLLSSSPPRRGHVPPPLQKGFLLLQDDAPPPFTPRGQGALSHLFRTRSYTSMKNSTTRSVVDDEESGLLSHGHPIPIAHSEPDDEMHRRTSGEEHRLSQLLSSAPMRSMRLIGNSNPRYQWEKYWKTEEQLKGLKGPVRRYYERTNYLIQQYLYIDRLLDSSLPHDLVNEYNSLPKSWFRGGIEVPDTIAEEPASGNLSGAGSRSYMSIENGSSNGHVGDETPMTTPAHGSEIEEIDGDGYGSVPKTKKVKRTPKDIYRATETTPLFKNSDDAVVDEQDDAHKPEIPWLEDDDELDSGDHIVTVAIYVNFAANIILLAGKIAVVFSVPSMSVLASLVDAVLDFLSTVIVWTTTWLISRQDQYQYPVGRRRLEPLGVLVFSVIMITSFAQVALESIQRLAAPNHEIVEVGISALCIMLSTVVIKGLCWLWCRLVKNSSVQALAADAMTDVIFNTGSILFPIIGFYAKIWWLDALGGLLLSLVVIFNWSQTSLEHIKNLSGFSATADQRNVLLYLTMRFAKCIKQIQGLQAYHAGDKLNIEVDIILDASTTLRDSHDLGESLSYVLESVPIVDRAFVHADYASYNLPTHMEQQQSG
ncbi:hypothetical protein F5Y15DRAFT_121983 [Xylariaceae sp. FL0016]|nr:hypothetical protein F5Y15DRAFT_121983 [Xylariaceae sp. FL0016]